MEKCFPKIPFDVYVSLTAYAMFHKNVHQSFEVLKVGGPYSFFFRTLKSDVSVDIAIMSQNKYNTEDFSHTCLRSVCTDKIILSNITRIVKTKANEHFFTRIVHHVSFCYELGIFEPHNMTYFSDLLANVCRIFTI